MPEIEKSYNDLISKVKKYSPLSDLSMIEKAFDFAKKCHKNQKRKSGDPFITHPLAVAHILADHEQDPTTIAAAMLHDSVEDSKLSLTELEKKFGHEISYLVGGVTKLTRLSFSSKAEHQAENFRKMFLAMAQDIRVIIIKVADRVHNMKTIKFLPIEKQKEISEETRDIYAPLAHRLGMWNIKWALEDLSFAIIQTNEYKKIKSFVAEKRAYREKYIKDFIKSVEEELKKLDIKTKIKGRAKHFYSIYQKMIKQNISFDELFDILAIRIIVDSVKDCYTALGIIHAMWKPISGKFDDYIAMPKSNMYQSLHTAIIGPHGKPVEVQIRTNEMNKIAEYGVASHWKYKEGVSKDKKFENKLTWIRQLVEMQKDMKNAEDFLHSLKIDFFTDEVFVFTPKGDVHALPQGSTPVDFAYHVHTEVGHRCLGAKANGQITPLSQILNNGDICEIITSKEDQPKLGWLNFVCTANARQKIKQWFRRQKREENIKAGFDQLAKEVKANLINPNEVLNEEYLSPSLKKYNLKGQEELCLAIAQGEISALTIARKIKERFEKKFQQQAPSLEALVSKFKPIKKAKGSGIEVIGAKNIMINISKCCHPLPGDDIIGFITIGHGVSVHRQDCPNILNIKKEDKQRLIEVKWDEKRRDLTYSVNIEIKAFDRVGLLKDILTKISDLNTNIREANVKTNVGSFMTAHLIVDVRNTDHLNHIINTVKNLNDVFDVYRINK